MPRRPNEELRVEKKISLPAETVGRVELELFNPTTRKPQYGGWSVLINQLLTQWLEERKNPRSLTEIEEANARERE